MPVMILRHGSRNRYVGTATNYIIWGEDKGGIVSRIVDEIEFVLEIAKVVTFTLANPSTVNFTFELARTISKSLEISKSNAFVLAIERVKDFTLELARDVKKKLDL